MDLFFLRYPNGNIQFFSTVDQMFRTKKKDNKHKKEYSWNVLLFEKKICDVDGRKKVRNDMTSGKQITKGIGKYDSV